MLFFLLSGFLMAHLYWRQEPTRRNLWIFATSRFARVVPLYWLVVALSLVTPVFYDIPSLPVFTSHLLFLYGQSVLWTIPAEVQFYGLFALAWVISRRHPFALVLVGVIALAGCLLVPTAVVYVGDMPVSSALARALPFFAVGGFLGWAYTGYRDRLARFQSAWFAASLRLVPLIYPKVFQSLFGFTHAMWLSPIVIGALTLAFVGVVFLVPTDNPLIANPAGDFYGAISYSLYLLHLPVLMALSQAGWSQFGVLSLVVFLLIATLVSWLSYRLIEPPSRRLVRNALQHRDPSAPLDSP